MDYSYIFHGIMQKHSRKFIKERLLRSKIFVLLKKNAVVIVIILCVALSFLLGFWNIQKYEIYSNDGGEVSPKTHQMMSDYLDKNVVGKNYFEIYTEDLEKDLANNLSYVESVEVRKNIPNILILFVKEYIPKLTVHTQSGKCYLLAEDGTVLEELCKDSTETECCANYSSANEKYLFNALDTEVVKKSEEKSKLLVMGDIKDIIKVVELFNIRIKEITLDKNVLTITDISGRAIIFSMNDDLKIQLERFYLVMSKIKKDGIDFDSIDVRFERPVMKIRINS